jgi:hypothetical protein
MKTREEIAEEYSNRFDDGSAKFRYKAFLVGYEQALKEIEAEVVQVNNLLDVKDSVSPGGWQRAAFEYVLNVVRARKSE